MTLHPGAQERAHEELDCIVGRDRLPTFEDRESLPYVNALLKEVLRWFPVGPVGVPHLTTSEDVYQGFTFPKGSIVFPNVW
jgi:cytochrome P450